MRYRVPVGFKNDLSVRIGLHWPGFTCRVILLRQRQQIFDLEDEIAQKRDDLITALERRMTQKSTSEPLFTIAWQAR
jgi:hypothetical protein